MKFNFIILTLAPEAHQEGKDVIVNPDHITHFHGAYPRGEGTFVYLSNDKVIWVTESIEEIKGKIGPIDKNVQFVYS